jgi:chloramphenicol 3-O-phosphotransferase
MRADVYLSDQGQALGDHLELDNGCNVHADCPCRYVSRLSDCARRYATCDRENF